MLLHQLTDYEHDRETGCCRAAPPCLETLYATKCCAASQRCQANSQGNAVLQSKRIGVRSMALMLAAILSAEGTARDSLGCHRCHPRLTHDFAMRLANSNANRKQIVCLAAFCDDILLRRSSHSDTLALDKLAIVAGGVDALWGVIDESHQYLATSLEEPQLLELFQLFQ